MNQPITLRHGAARTLAALLLTTGLAACHGGNAPDQSAAASSANALAALPAPLPMSTAQPTALPPAPPVTALPAAASLHLGRLPDARQGYAYLDRAYYQQDAVEDAPPDYAFDDQGVQPWVWQAGDNGRVICEPVAGGYRYYYYNPGASTPYLVRDTDRAYAYNGDVLVGVFTLAGAMMNYGPQSPPALYSARYFDRGRMLWSHAESGPHQPMNAYAWDERRRDLAARRNAWQQQMAANAAWSGWANTHRQEEQSAWQPVREQHQQAAQAFDGWQQQRFAGPQPRFYGPNPAAENHAAMVGAAAVGAAGAAALAAHAVMQHNRPAPPPPPDAMVPNDHSHAPGPLHAAPMPQEPRPGPPAHPPQPSHAPVMPNGNHQHPDPPHPAPAAPAHEPQAIEHAAHHPMASPVHPAMPQEPHRPAEPIRPPVEAPPHHAPPAEMPYHAPPAAPAEHAPPAHAMPQPAPAAPRPPAPHPAPAPGGGHEHHHG